MVRAAIESSNQWEWRLQPERNHAEPSESFHRWSVPQSWSGLVNLCNSRGVVVQASPFRLLPGPILPFFTRLWYNMNAVGE